MGSCRPFLAPSSTAENDELEMDLTIRGLDLARLVMEPVMDLARFPLEDDKVLAVSRLLGRLTEDV